VTKHSVRLLLLKNEMKKKSEVVPGREAEGGDEDLKRRGNARGGWGTSRRSSP